MVVYAGSNPASRFISGAWRSLASRFVRDEEAAGSNPAAPIQDCFRSPTGRGTSFRNWRVEVRILPRASAFAFLATADYVRSLSSTAERRSHIPVTEVQLLPGPFRSGRRAIPEIVREVAHPTRGRPEAWTLPCANARRSDGRRLSSQIRSCGSSAEHQPDMLGKAGSTPAGSISGSCGLVADPLLPTQAAPVRFRPGALARRARSSTAEQPVDNRPMQVRVLTGASTRGGRSGARLRLEARAARVVSGQTGSAPPPSAHRASKARR